MTSYLLYALNERHRFYPEMLTSIIPKLFVKPSNMTYYEYLTKIYDHSFKHAWSVDLNDKEFNKYYKLITTYHHVSVNYNREIIDKPNYDNINSDCFSDVLLLRLSKHRLIQSNDIKEFQVWLYENNYDTETMEYDMLSLNDDSNAKRYLYDIKTMSVVIREFRTPFF